MSNLIKLRPWQGVAVAMVVILLVTGCGKAKHDGQVAAATASAPATASPAAPRTAATTPPPADATAPPPVATTPPAADTPPPPSAQQCMTPTQANIYLRVALTATNSVLARDAWELTAEGHSDASDKVWMSFRFAGGGNGKVTWGTHNGADVTWDAGVYVTDKAGAHSTYYGTPGDGTGTESPPFHLTGGQQVVLYGVLQTGDGCRPVDGSRPVLSH